MNTFSIIVPIFHGIPYMESLVRQAEDNRKKLGKEDRVELLFVNDDPQKALPRNYKSDLIRIVFLDTDRNRGIHGARVRGLEACTGDYVLFLDQDDRIAPDYFSRQMECLKGHAGVVCQVIHEKKRYYNAEYPFHQMMAKEYMLMKGSPIVSPGQVLLRREAIPKTWKEEILTKNGADDFLLWLCMAAEEKTFALNEDVLFEHIVQYGNTSWNSYDMMRSEEEMVGVLKRNQVFSKEDTIKLEKMLQGIQKRRLNNLDKFRKMFYILKDLCMAEADGNRIHRYLEEKNLYDVAVYGGGYLGKYLLKKLEGSKVSVRYVIDKNAPFLDIGYPAFTLEEELEDVDGVIVTLVYGEELVVDKIRKKLGTYVLTIKELAAGLSK